MQTEVLTVDAATPQPEVIARAAAVLRRGGLVAVPTETVYGLAADALNEAAVRGIFAAKGRPANNPLIVHAAGVAEAQALAAAWPAAAERLAAAFWPGPLSLVLPKRPNVPDVVTAGGSTVALRVPIHPVARALIEASGRPLAAPSANPSTRVSSVTADHVRRGLTEKVDLILDGGATPGGLESTVVDVSGAVPRLLRPGPIGIAALQEALGTIVVEVRSQATVDDGALPSPGLLRRHYSPAVPLDLTDDDGRRRVAELIATGRTVGWIPWGVPLAAASNERVLCMPLSRRPIEYAAKLYSTLHDLEACGVDAIVVERPPATAAWSAVLDRLLRASAR